ncbi:hypothetical protein AUC69_01975 [Methyloceanibacter superfactus]|uniref:Uncharacterized protein n=1 Tax=Methyloceanibacter superfactus TaxID=1774969 RepID=A0A1E3VST5_9HYPH|nr:hypothetical protein AUC69_01975 [Methyloceanibacter superfactus]
MQPLGVVVGTERLGRDVALAPASSKASRAAISALVMSGLAQPLGMVQRPMARVVISRTRGPLCVFTKGNAATCFMGVFIGQTGWLRGSVHAAASLRVHSDRARRNRLKCGRIATAIHVGEDVLPMSKA